MLALAGRIQGNTVLLENESIERYDGQQIIVTFLDYQQNERIKPLDFDSYVTPTERGQHVEEYMEEIRGNDRI